jgi:hypothetical protein
MSSTTTVLGAAVLAVVGVVAALAFRRRTGPLTPESKVISTRRTNEGGSMGFPRGDERRYDNLVNVSGALQSYGMAVKYLAAVALVVGVIGGFAGSNNTGFAVAIVFAAVLAAVSLYAAGLMIAAMGEGLLALADIATNTGKMPAGSRDET